MKYLIPIMACAASLPALAQTGQVAEEGKDTRVTLSQSRGETGQRPSGPSRKDRTINLMLARDLLLQRYDADGDGVLNEDEKKALVKDAEQARDEARKRFFQQFDKDGDGKLSKEEIQNFRETLKTHRHPNPDGADMVLPPPPHGKRTKDSNGKEQGEDEKKVQGIVRQVGKERFVVRPSVFMLLQALIMERYDRNGNGRIDPDEHRQLKADAEAVYKKKCDELLALYDRNGDGKLDGGEKESVIASRDVRQKTEALRNIRFDDIDRFIKKSFEEELMDMLEEDTSGKAGQTGGEPDDAGK